MTDLANQEVTVKQTTLTHEGRR